MDKQRTASAISGGIFLISLGILIFTGWWWPGIMFAIGLSSVNHVQPEAKSFLKSNLRTFLRG